MLKGPQAAQLREQLLKRTPIAAELVYSTSRFYPIKRRAAMCNADVAAAALVQSGAAYFPPNSGGIVRFCGGGAIAGTVPWTFSIITVDDYNNLGSGPFGNGRVRPLWPDAPLRGQWVPSTFFGLGNFYAQHIEDSLCGSLDLEVMPGNVFVMMNGTTASAFSGFACIEEPLDGDENL